MTTLLDKLTKDLERKECITLKMSAGTAVPIDPEIDKIGIVTEQNTTWVHIKNDNEKTEEFHNLNFIQSIVIEYK